MTRAPSVSRLFVALVVSACGGGGSGGGGDDAGRMPDARSDAAASVCRDDLACDDGLFCNGEERCSPSDPGADSEGCVTAAAGPCLSEQQCSETSSQCVATCPDADGDGHEEVSCGGDDCDDTDAGRFPGNTEVCDAGGHDEDCNPATLGPDGDGDQVVALSCCNVQGDGSLLCGTDCNDGNAEVNPSEPEVCNGVDEDCDGAVDDGVLTIFVVDADGDGFGSNAADALTMSACAQPMGYSDVATDCDDGDPRRNPALAEVCDGIDNDCDGLLDGPGEDDDGDGFADTCAGLGPALTDCDDTDSAIHPGAVERCNGIDDDCSGAPATGDDLDGDGQVHVSSTCVGMGFPRTDCDDGVATTYLGAPELCNLVDDDCDGVIDGSTALCSLTAADSACVGGQCTIVACQGTALDCDSDDATGCEAETQTSDEHCGGCGIACGAFEQCQSASCTNYVAWVFGTAAWVEDLVAGGGGGEVFLAGHFGDNTDLAGTTLVNVGPCGGGGCPEDMVVARIGATGAPDWITTFGGTDYDGALSVAYGADSVAVTGAFESGNLTVVPGDPDLFSFGNQDVVVAKLDATDGAPLWARAFGGSQNDSGRHIGIDGDGNVFIGGQFQSTVLPLGTNLSNAGFDDIFVAKLDGADGTPLWARPIGSGDFDVLAGLAVTGDGDVVVAGYFQTETLLLGGITIMNSECFPSGGGEMACTREPFTARLDGADGSVLWARAYAGTGRDYVDALDLADDGSLILPGTFEGTLAGVTLADEALVFTADASDGSALWASPFDAPGFFWAAEVSGAPGGSVYVAGAAWSPTFTFGDRTYTTQGNCTGGCSSDIVVGRFDPSGSPVWSTAIAGDLTEYPDAIDVNGAGRLFLAGNFVSPTITIGGTTLTGSGAFGDYRFFVTAFDVQ